MAFYHVFFSSFKHTNVLHTKDQSYRIDALCHRSVAPALFSFVSFWYLYLCQPPVWCSSTRVYMVIAPVEPSSPAWVARNVDIHPWGADSERAECGVPACVAGGAKKGEIRCLFGSRDKGARERVMALAKQTPIAFHIIATPTLPHPTTLSNAVRSNRSLVMDDIVSSSPLQLP